MPIKKAALKRMKSDRKLKARNSWVLNELKTLSRKFEKLIASNNREGAQALFKEVSRKFDKAFSRGIIHKNRASRKKARLAKRLSKFLAA